MKKIVLVLTLFGFYIPDVFSATDVAARRSDLVVPKYSIGDYEADVLIDGRVVMAMQRAIECMREYRDLTSLGRRVDSYKIGIKAESEKGVVEFLFTPRSESLSNNLKVKGAYEMRIDVRLSDLKVLRRTLHN